MQRKVAVKARSGVSLGQFFTVGGAMEGFFTTPGTCYLSRGGQEVGLIGLGHIEQDGSWCPARFPLPALRTNLSLPGLQSGPPAPAPLLTQTPADMALFSFLGLTLRIVGT